MVTNYKVYIFKVNFVVVYGLKEDISIVIWEG